jgi:hypothetical protein
LVEIPGEPGASCFRLSTTLACQRNQGQLLVNAETGKVLSILVVPVWSV